MVIMNISKHTNTKERGEEYDDIVFFIITGCSW